MKTKRYKIPTELLQFVGTIHKAVDQHCDVYCTEDPRSDRCRKDCPIRSARRLMSGLFLCNDHMPESERQEEPLGSLLKMYERNRKPKTC